MASTNISTQKNSLYNEQRNLLRIQAKERRNQEAHQERETFPAAIPLFEKPYKIHKADELSNRIQKMFGDYEEMKELIAAKSPQNYIGIPESVMSLIPPHKPDRPLFPEKTTSVLPPSFQNNSYHHKPLGPLPSSAPPAGNSVHYQKAHSRTEPASQSGGMPSHQRQSQQLSCKTQEIPSSRRQQKNERCMDEDITREVQASLLHLSPLLSTLSSPIAPLSPLHSGQRLNSRPQSSSSNTSKKPGQKSSPPQEPVAGTRDNETQDSVSAAVTVAAQPSSQTFPSSLSSKSSAIIQQKPTAYVRPMDGQDQAPDESPELKPLPKEYHEPSYGKITTLKANAKTNLPKLKIPAEPIEQSFSNEVHCVEEILKEMTHSWPPLLTAIHTPSTAEPSKFPFPAKETQHGGSGIQSQKQYDAPSKSVSTSQQTPSTLREDLEISDSEDGDDDQVSVSDKPSSSSTPPSAPPSQPESVALAHSSSPESGSTSDSDSSSDSESESSSSDSEANGPPTRTSTPEQEDHQRNDQKKARLDKETKSFSSSGHKDSSKIKISKPSTETQRKEMPLPPPPPLSPIQPAQKPAKTTHKRPKGESSACSQPSNPILSTAKSKESRKDLSSSSKHRRLEGKPSESSKSNKGSAEDVPNPFPVPSLPNGTSKPTKPQCKPYKQNPAEFHLNEAKRLKHKADAMTEKVGKAFKYLDSALSFIECGISLESDPVLPKPAYSIFADTIELIKFIMTLKSFADSSTTTPEKIFIVFCMRCQAILYMAMFRYKKDTAIKYSRTLNEHFKSSSKITQAPSPCVARSTGTPSPLSPMPSPAGSVSSQTGSTASSCGSGGIGSSINVPPYIPTITSSFVNITSYILYAYDLWEQADVLAKRNKKFFSDLNAAACNLSLNSSMIELVHYTRQGLQWLRLEPNTL
nr:AF4/FMR2 family member 1 isoform X5 [Anolis sagrei ordinatus]